MSRCVKTERSIEGLEKTLDPVFLDRPVDVKAMSTPQLLKRIAIEVTGNLSAQLRKNDITRDALVEAVDLMLQGQHQAACDLLKCHITIPN